MNHVLLGLLSIFGANSSMAVDEPKFEILLQREHFEIRRYGPVLVAEVHVDTDFESAGNAGFRPLGEYIFGSNESKTKISMTAPVSQSETIAMTAPVSQSPRATGGHTVQFTMPEGYTLETLPKPKDARVKLRAVPSRTVAVHRYSGTWSQSRFEEHHKILLDALTREKIAVTGPVEFARYNPPILPWFMRRNEVWLPVTYSAP